MCQDTGIAVFFIEVGRGVELDGSSLEDAVNEGVRQGYKDGYLRKSVCHPLKRVNTGDNTPAIIHTTIVEGDRVKIKIAPKGAGSENMSALKMLKPAEGVNGVKSFVLDTVRAAGGNPCPPIVVGVGIGGSFEKSAILAKKALLRPIGSRNADVEVEALEAELLKSINDLGIANGLWRRCYGPCRSYRDLSVPHRKSAGCDKHTVPCGKAQRGCFMSEPVRITPPLSDADVLSLKAGDKVLITGVMYTARDAAHKRLIELLDRGEKLPFDIKGQIIYYVGPTPAKPGAVIGSAGPTTSGRMDAYTPRLLDLGLKGMVGKGARSKEVLDAMSRNKAVYLAAVGGAAALIARSIKKAEIIAYEDLGPEAIRRLEVLDFPAIVALDATGGDLFKQGVEKYRRVV